MNEDLRLPKLETEGSFLFTRFLTLNHPDRHAKRMLLPAWPLITGVHASRAVDGLQFGFRNHCSTISMETSSPTMFR